MLRRGPLGTGRRPRSAIVGPAAAEPLTEAEWRLKRVLRAVTAILVAATLGLAVVAAIGSIGSALRDPPWTAGALGGGLLLASLSALAAGHPRRRLGLAWLLAAALAAAALAQLAYLVAGEGAGRPLGAAATTSDRAMAPVLALELLLAAAIAVLAFRAARAGSHSKPIPSRWDSSADAGLRPLLGILGAAAAVIAAVGVAGPFVDPLRDLLAQPLLSAHLAAAALAAAGLCWYVAAAIRDRLPLVAALVVSLVALAASAGLDLLHGPRDPGVELLGLTPSAAAILIVAGGAALALAVALAALRRRAIRARLQPRFLGPTGYRALIALADVLVEGPDEAVPPREIAANVDRYFARMRARRRVFHRIGLVVMQLHPLLSLEAPFSELDEESRVSHLETRFHRAVRQKRFPPEPLRRYVQAMLRLATQLTYIGYYSDRRSFAGVGYVRFSERERYARLDREGLISEPGEHPLAVDRAPELATHRLEADYCVIGSGAAGAILAHRLAETGSVIVLERGEYVEPREFSDDEVEMIGRLYGDGVFQQSEDFRFTVLQGSCVGGSTVVNNAVSIPLPAPTLRRWNERHGAGIDPEAFEASTAAVKRRLRIAPQEEGEANPGLRLNPGHPQFLAGVERRHGDDGELAVSAVAANLDGCLGCGYCNIGCRYGRKLSMLDTVLPWAQREFGSERVRIVSECEVGLIVTSGRTPGRVTAVEARLPDGDRLEVRAGKVVLAAGAVASPYLLKRSRIGRGLPVGEQASFNMGAALTAEYEDELDAYDGLQISHLGIPRSDRGWVLETWWNPPVAQALNMPGWFESHYENMRRYRRLMAVGALVGTERNARIGRAVTGGPAIRYAPAPGDLRKLADGLAELGRILFAGGAREVMLNAWDEQRFTHPDQLDVLPQVLGDPGRVALGTGHPQGGNAIGGDPRAAVVDPSFRVHGHSNLYVCDASVFPTSITVNPQLTVMALADYAAPRIAADRGV